MVYLLFVVGLYLLVKSADWIIDSSSSMAKKLGVSSLVIGLTVVAFGTSLPELVVNVVAAFKGAAEVSFGNIVGSNIANILLILGVTALIANVKIESDTVWKEIPFALLSAFVFFALTTKVFFGGDNFFRWNDGLILLALFVMFLYYVFRMAKKDRSRLGFTKDVEESNWKIGLMFLLGVVGIYFGGRWTVDGAIFVAGQFGMSEYLISATIVALGTSLPELVVCVVAVLKKNIDLAVGNIIGSNIFNVLWVFGVIPFIGAVKIPAFIGFDIAILFMATLLLFLLMFVGEKNGLGKKEGFVFLVFYVLYILFLIVRG